MLSETQKKVVALIRNHNFQVAKVFGKTRYYATGSKNLNRRTVDSLIKKNIIKIVWNTGWKGVYGTLRLFSSNRKEQGFDTEQQIEDLRNKGVL